MLFSDISYVLRLLYAQNMKNKFLQIIYCSKKLHKVLTF